MFSNTKVFFLLTADVSVHLPDQILNILKNVPHYTFDFHRTLSQIDCKSSLKTVLLFNNSCGFFYVYQKTDNLSTEIVKQNG